MIVSQYSIPLIVNHRGLLSLRVYKLLHNYTFINLSQMTCEYYYILLATEGEMISCKFWQFKGQFFDTLFSVVYMPQVFTYTFNLVYIINCQMHIQLFTYDYMYLSFSTLFLVTCSIGREKEYIYISMTKCF